jgi:hypothetical protein
MNEYIVSAANPITAKTIWKANVIIPMIMLIWLPIPDILGRLAVF